MKLHLCLLFILLSLNNFAQRDSIAFFYSETKVVVIVNELTPYGRLSDFIDINTNQESYSFISSNQNIKISCSRSDRGTGCRFIFKRSPSVIISNRSLKAKIKPTNNLDDTSIGFVMKFNSSMNDKFSLTVTKDKEFKMTGSKILRKSI